MPRRFRFSLGRLFLVITIVAIAAAAWRAYFVKHPTYYIGSYEKAPSTRSGSIAVGPNRITLNYVARNHRDGSITYEDGLGDAIQAASPDGSVLQHCATWLDVVEIELGPNSDAFDVIEARLFDHATRELLSTDDHYGWRLVAPNRLQCYGLKKKLPPKLDVWFRANSYDAAAPVSTIPAEIGTNSHTIAGDFSVDDLRQGSWSSSNGKLTQSTDLNRPATTAVFAIDFADLEEYQIVAVSRSGRHAYADIPHYLQNFPSSGKRREAILFPLPLNELDHFEVRRFGGRHRFFFEAVELPLTSPAPLASPPAVRVAVNGQEVNQRITDWEPIECTIATHRGNWSSGTASSGQSVWFHSRQGGATDPQRSFTTTYVLSGAGVPLQLQFFEAPSGTPIPQSQLRPTASSRAWGNASAGREVFNAPLGTIQAIEVTLQP